jgi:hypothetical protein
LRCQLWTWKPQETRAKEAGLANNTKRYLEA